MPYEATGLILVRLAGDEQQLLTFHPKSHLGDQVTIQASDSSRLMGVVIERSGEQLLLGFPDGTIVRLEMSSDDGFAEFKLSEGFSRQSWVIVA